MPAHRNSLLALPRTRGAHHARTRPSRGSDALQAGRATIHAPAPTLGLRRAAVGDLQRLHGNAHVQRFLVQPPQFGSPLRRQPQSQPTLRVGSRGPAVETLQQKLIGAGASVTVDGIFGPGTRSAVVSFQQGAGLAPDGIVGPQTWQRLQSGAVSLPPAGAKTADPQHAIVLAKLGQIRVAMQSLKAKSGAAPAAADPANTQAQGIIEPLVGPPIPSCGLHVPTGEAPTLDTGHAGHGHLQRSFLDDAEAWLEDKAEAASEWAGEKVDEATQAAGDAAVWAGDQINAAGEWASGAVDDVTQAASDVVAGASDFVQQEIDDAKAKVQEIVGEAKDAVEGGIDAVVQTATELAKDVGDFGDDLKKRFANEIAIVEQVMQELGKPFGDLGGLIKQLDDVLKGLAGADPKTGFFGWFDDPKPDPKANVYAEFDVASSIQRGGVKVPGGTGYSEPTFKIDNVSWFRATDDALYVQARLNIDCRYEIASAGRGTSITSANDPAVTKISYLTIIHDLEEMSESYLKPYPVQTTFWSEPLIVRHEEFHCRDYIGQAVNFLPTAKSWLESQEVTQGPGGDSAIDKQVHALLDQMRQQIHDDGLAYFKNGGEARAYGDGKGSYQALINQIKARAKAEKWE